MTPAETMLAQRAWIDLLVVSGVCALHAVSRTRWAGEFPQDQGARRDAADAITRTVGAAITVVGILVPATILVARLGTPPPGTLAMLFVADLWPAISLILGLYVLWAVAARGGTGNALSHLDIAWAYGWQLITLAAGVGRLTVGLCTILR